MQFVNSYTFLGHLNNKIVTVIPGHFFKSEHIPYVQF
jgi:hypothetical protein